MLVTLLMLHLLSFEDSLLFTIRS